MSNSKLNKLRSRIKTDTEVTLKTLSNVADDSNDEMIFFCISCYYLLHKFQNFVKLLKIITKLV